MSAFAGLPPFVFGTRAWVDQLVCPLRTYVRANDGTRDLLAPMLTWSAGPPAIGDTGDNSPGHLTGTTWLLQVCPTGDWVLYREARGQLEVMTFDDPPDPVTATARHVSLAFDQSARVVLAWEDQGVIKVRRWDASQNQYIENVSFSGHDPVVVFDATWRYLVPDSDVLLFYLSSDRTRVLCRVQRDVYAVEYEIWDYDSPVILDRVLATPYKYQILVSDALGEPLPYGLLSELYPVAVHFGARLASEFTSGDYAQAAFPYYPAVGAALSSEFVSGDYFAPIVKYEPDFGVALASEFTGGDYFSPIVKYEPDFGAALSSEFASGDLDEIGVLVTPDVGVALSSQFIGGVYEPG